MATPMPSFPGPGKNADKIDAAFPLDDQPEGFGSFAPEVDNAYEEPVHVAGASADPLNLGREEPEVPSIAVQRGGLRFPVPSIITAVRPQIYGLLSKVMAEVKAVGKTGVNQQQGYNFRGIDAVVNALGPAMRTHGVVPVPRKVKVAYRETMTTGNKPTREVTVQVTYRFYAPDGSYVDAKVIGESLDQSDKGSAKAMSVAYRIALLQVFALPTDEPDPDAQYHTRDGIGSMSAGVSALLLRTVGNLDIQASELAEVWPIVLEHSAAERAAPGTPHTWSRLFADAFGRLVDKVETAEDGLALWNVLKPIGFLNVPANHDDKIAVLGARLNDRAAFLKERTAKSYDHVMQHIQAATSPEEIETAIGCAEANLETQILSPKQVEELTTVARERQRKLEREQNVAAPADPSGAPELDHDSDGFRLPEGPEWERFVEDCINYSSFVALMDLLTNEREDRAAPASAWGEAGMVRVLDAIKRAHRKEHTITDKGRAELVQALKEHAEMSGIKIVITEGTA